MKKYKRIMILLFLVFILSVIYWKEKSYPEEKVIISQDSIVTEEKSLTVSMKTKRGYKIYYTLDGSTPTKKSKRYRKAITINRYSSPDYLSLKENQDKMVGQGINIDSRLLKGTVLKAVAIAPNGKSGKVETRTYFIGRDNKNLFKNTTVVSIVTDPDNLLGKEGIFTKENYDKKGKEWEREAHIDFFDGDLTPAWSKEVGIRVKGNISRKESQKSLNVYFREDYGDKKLEYSLWSDNNIDSFKAFTLRNGGNTADTLKYKDQVLQDLVKDRKVETQTGRVAIALINGEYWGPFDLQEKYSSDYYAKHYDLEKDNIIVIKEGEVDEGKEENIKFYEELMEYVNKDLSDPSIYQEFQELVDIDSMIDYHAIEIYIGSGDWGNINEKSNMKNTQLWRTREKEEKEYGDTKWRWSIFDLEYSSSLYGYKETKADFNSIERAKIVQPLFGSAMKNKEFENKFYETLKEIGKNNFNPEKVEEIMTQSYNKWELFMLDYDKRFKL